ncbi:MAG TPA: DUF3558 family protein, partial [Longimicrobiales bacterium]|nr:DUF3558 family protein [Longimicrobiales bacterium]
TAAAGCAGGEEQEPAEAASAAAGEVVAVDDIDACTLLTADEIRSATGYDPGPGADPVADISGAAPICAWPSADGSVHQVVQVLVAYATSDTYEEYLQAMAEQGVIEGLSRIEGPGRFTVLLAGANMAQAHGERFMVQVMVEPAAGIDPVTAMTTLAGAALARIE